MSIQWTQATGVDRKRKMPAEEASLVDLVPIDFSGIPWDPQFFKKTTLWLFDIAMEHGPFIDGLPIKNGDFPWLC